MYIHYPSVGWVGHAPCTLSTDQIVNVTFHHDGFFWGVRMDMELDLLKEQVLVDFTIYPVMRHGIVNSIDNVELVKVGDVFGKWGIHRCNERHQPVMNGAIHHHRGEVVEALFSLLDGSNHPPRPYEHFLVGDKQIGIHGVVVAKSFND